MRALHVALRVSDLDRVSRAQHLRRLWRARSGPCHRAPGRSHVGLDTLTGRRGPARWAPPLRVGGPSL